MRTLVRLLPLALAAGLLVPVGPAGQSASAAAPGGYCGYSGQAGLDTYRWTGAYDDEWGDYRNWTKNGVALTVGQAPPGGNGAEQPNDLSGNPTVNISRNRDYVCIPSGSTVHLGGDNEWNARIQALDVAGTPSQPTSVHVDSGANLRVFGAQATRPSVLRSNVTLLLNGGLGGTGRIDLRGTLQARATMSGAPGFLTRRCSTEATACQTAATARGLLVVENSGRLIVDDLGVNISDYYRIRVHGLVRLSNDGYLAADHGTRFELEPNTGSGAGVGTLQIANDGGYYEGSTPPAGDGLSRFANNGRILKSGGAGTSVISADYSATASSVVRVAAGTVVLPDGAVRPASVAAGRRYGTAACVYVGSYACTTVADAGVDDQAATFKVPTADSDGASVAVTEVTGSDPYRPGDAVGDSVSFHATQLTATASAPAILELRYDELLLSGQTPLTMIIGRLASGGTSYVTVPTCLGNGTPPGAAVACVDRRGQAGSSRWASDDPQDLIMVVRTRATSRWVGR
ncbi:hypothetical protein [Nocardioides stalactiti]|uniref:hypothetical protein n=1 Tax=Nocardioides stalactiti TaxID=2755356 RepID=UPI0016012A14|nr:hypothetical protein [Nocardioides stalactiti]